MARSILVVDDERQLLSLISDILEKEGYTVATNPSPRAALEELQKTHYDLLIFDLFMPEIPGVELLQKIRDLRLSMPVLIMTGRPALDTARQTLELGAAQYLVKPFSHERLIQAVERALQLPPPRRSPPV